MFVHKKEKELEELIDKLEEKTSNKNIKD